MFRLYDQRLVGNKKLTPIHITVRDYGERKSRESISILEFIESVSNSSYQLKPPPGAVEYLLRSGRVLLIFDGLDELLDTSYRKQIVEDIESFCNVYPTLPVLVTSREVGYHQAPLSSKDFEVYKLKDFNDDQIETYANKWFSLDTELTQREKLGKVEAFLAESKVADDLRTNPLMLGLMCSIYRGENYIPQNRPDLYEKCSVMLFERWDKSRGINPQLKFEAHLRPGMMYLANWIYRDGRLQKGVSEQALIEKTTDYLETFYQNRNEAEFVAQEFVEFCRGRAWVFTDVGDGIYQFTHQTFLEYFTACYLNRTLRTAKNLTDEFLPRISLGEWDVVAQLSLQIFDKQFEGGTDEVVQRILAELEGGKWNPERNNIVSFLVRSLVFVVPKYETRRKIVECFFKILLAFLKQSQPLVSKASRESNQNQLQSQLQTLNFLIDTKSENSDSLVDLTKEYLTQKIEVAGMPELQFLLHTAFFLMEASPNKFNGEFQTEIIAAAKSNPAEIPDLPVTNLLIKYHCEILTADDLLRTYGIRALFEKMTLLNLYRTRRLSFTVFNFLFLDYAITETEKRKAHELLSSLGRCFNRSYWLTTKIKPSLPRFEKFVLAPAGVPPLEGDLLFGAIIFLSIFIEAYGLSSNVCKAIEEATKDKSPLSHLFRQSKTINSEELSKINSDLLTHGLTHEQVLVIETWLTMKYRFLKATNRLNDDSVWVFPAP